jgi:hypothetical protein
MSPARSHELRSAAKAAASFAAYLGKSISDAVIYDTETAMRAAARAGYASTFAAQAAGDPAKTINAAASAAYCAADAAYSAAARKIKADAGEVYSNIIWAQIRAELTDLRKGGMRLILEEQPLWSSGVPKWAQAAWADLKTVLTEGEDWEVWIDWYEDRLQGGSRGEAYERVFANVPVEMWSEGHAAANAGYGIISPEFAQL